MTRIPGPCTRDRHRFGISSGWCLNGCGWRDDGQSAINYRMPSETDPRDFTEPLRATT